MKDSQYKAFLKAKDDHIIACERRIAALKAENERLKCCGNCKHFAAVDDQTCEHPDRDTYTYDIPAYVSVPDPCEMVPDRWTAREDG